MQQYLPFTVLKLPLATTSTLYVSIKWLQQYLPFTVLKQNASPIERTLVKLQQYLPFTVLKLAAVAAGDRNIAMRCNSTYRLRYWNFIKDFVATINKDLTLQQYLPFTVLKHIDKINHTNKIEFETVINV